MTGTITFNTINYLTGKIDYSVTQDTENSKSIITTNLYAKKTVSAQTYGKTWKGYVKVGDNTAHSFTSLSKTTYVSDSYVLLATYTDEIVHTSSGIITVNISGWVNGPTETSLEDTRVSGNADVELPSISKADTFTMSTLDLVATTTSGITTAVTGTVTKQDSSNVDNLIVFSGLREFMLYYYGDLTSYSVKKTNVSGTFNINSLITGNDIITILNNFESGFDKEDETISPYFAVETYNGDTYLGFSLLELPTITITDLAPSLTSSVFNDTTTQTVTGNSSTICSKLIPNKTKINVTYTINLKANATISSATIGGLAATINNNVVSIANVSQTNLNLSLTDSRGYTLTTTDNTLTTISYTQLAIDSLETIKRNTPVDGKIKVNFNGNYYNGNLGATNNALTVKYKIWEYGDDEPAWDDSSVVTLANAITTSNTYVTINTSTNKFSVEYTTPANYDYNSRWNIAIQVTDKLGTINATKQIPKGIPVIWWTKDNFHTSGDLYVGLTGGSNKIYLNGSEFKVEVDDEMSSTSENPVQNKVVNTALANKQDTLTTTTSTIGSDSGIITRVSGATIDRSEWAMYGNIITIYLQLAAYSTASGGTMFTGTLAGAYRPKLTYVYSASEYGGARVPVIRISKEGEVLVKNAGTTTLNGTTRVSITYVI